MAQNREWNNWEQNKIYINYGTDMQEMVFQIMDAARIAEEIRKDAKVCIKPNLVLSKPADSGATTHPEIVEGIIQYLLHHGIKNITIAEGSWVGENSTHRAFQVCGYTQLAEHYRVKLHDTKKDAGVSRKYWDFQLQVCESIADCDYLINVPVLKGHCQTYMTCCLKNLKGCIPDKEKRRYHTMGLHVPIAALNTAIKPSLHIVDSICGDLDFEEGGNPVESNRILLGKDGVLLDSYCAGLMGYSPEEISHLGYARDYGVGRFMDESTSIVELNRDRRPKNTKKPSGTVKQLAKYIEEDQACSACYAALIYALNKVGTRSLPEPVKIGQGFRGKNCGGIGAGNCTSGCDKYVKGCPPTALEIVEFLNSI